MDEDEGEGEDEDAHDALVVVDRELGGGGEVAKSAVDQERGKRRNGLPTEEMIDKSGMRSDLKSSGHEMPTKEMVDKSGMRGPDRAWESRGGVGQPADADICAPAGQSTAGRSACPSSFGRRLRW